jgi:hypothetical protein
MSAKAPVGCDRLDRNLRTRAHLQRAEALAKRSVLSPAGLAFARVASGNLCVLVRLPLPSQRIEALLCFVDSAGFRLRDGYSRMAQ